MSSEGFIAFFLELSKKFDIPNWAPKVPELAKHHWDDLEKRRALVSHWDESAASSIVQGVLKDAVASHAAALAQRSEGRDARWQEAPSRRRASPSSRRSARSSPPSSGSRTTHIAPTSTTATTSTTTTTSTSLSRTPLARHGAGARRHAAR